jgi:hypothetical protein
VNTEDDRGPMPVENRAMVEVTGRETKKCRLKTIFAVSC